MKFSTEIRQTHISQNKLEGASQGCENVLVNKRAFIVAILVFHIKQVFRFCIYIYIYMYLCLEPRMHHKLLNTILRELNVFD